MAASLEYASNPNAVAEGLSRVTAIRGMGRQPWAVPILATVLVKSHSVAYH